MIAAALCLGLATFRPINHRELPTDRSEFTFAVLGDNRPAGAGLPPTAVFADIVQQIGWIKPEFVLSTGDLVYGNEDTPAQYRKECDDVHALIDRINTPFFNAPGNHEIAERKELQDIYRGAFGELYGSFDFGGYRFVALCTDEAGFLGRLSPAQDQWATQALDGTKPSFVFLHRPVFARAGNDEEGATVKGAEDLHRRFAASNVQAVFEGHDHVFNAQSHDGIKYFIAGGAGAPLDADPEEGGFFHFMLVHVKDGKVKYETIPANSIQVTSGSKETRVANYCDEDLDLGDFTMHLAKRPMAIKGIVDKKGQLKEIPVTIASVDRDRKGVTAHLKFTLPKHRMTILTPTY